MSMKKTRALSYEYLLASYSLLIKQYSLSLSTSNSDMIDNEWTYLSSVSAFPFQKRTFSNLTSMCSSLKVCCLWISFTCWDLDTSPDLKRMDTKHYRNRDWYKHAWRTACWPNGGTYALVGNTIFRLAYLDTRCISSLARMTQHKMQEKQASQDPQHTVELWKFIKWDLPLTTKCHMNVRVKINAITCGAKNNHELVMI